MSFEMLSDFLSLTELLTVPAILSLLTVSFMGVVLGIDNVVFIAVIAKRAPKGGGRLLEAAHLAEDDA